MTDRRPPPSTPHPDEIGKPSIYDQAAASLVSTQTSAVNKAVTNHHHHHHNNNNSNNNNNNNNGNLQVTSNKKEIDISSISLYTPTSSKSSSQPRLDVRQSDQPSSSSSSHVNPNIPKLPANLSAVNSASIVPLITPSKMESHHHHHDHHSSNKNKILPPTIKTASSSVVSKPTPITISQEKDANNNNSHQSRSRSCSNSNKGDDSNKGGGGGGGRGKSGGVHIDLMEAMASQDYSSMAAAMQVASDREIHACMLNACAKGNIRAVNILLSKSPEHGLVQGAFICARNGHLELLKLLLETTNDPKTIDNSLVQAASKGHFALVQHIISLRSASTDAMKRALISAATKAQYPVIEMLIPNVEWDARRDALVLCCKQNHIQCASLLIEDLPGRYMEQPLAICASMGHMKLIQQILASPTANDIEVEGISHARSVAEASSHWQIVELLSQYASYPSSNDGGGDGGYGYGYATTTTGPHEVSRGGGQEGEYYESTDEAGYGNNNTNTPVY
jgi:hypothetical protein